MKHYVPAILVFVLISAFTLVAFSSSYSNYKASIQATFDQAGAVRAQAIQRSLRDKELILESTSQLFQENRANLSGAGLRSFVAPFESEMEGVQALQLVVPVTAAAREKFESARRREGIPGFELRERSAGGRMVRAAERDIYYTVLPLPPIQVGEASIGYDLYSDPVRRDAITAAVQSGELRVSAWVRLIQEEAEDSFGFLMFVPIFPEADTGRSASARNAESPGGLLGLVTGIFRINDIVRDSVSILAGEPIVLTLREDAADEAGHRLSLTVTPASKPDLFRGFTPEDFESRIGIGGKSWIFEASPAAGYMKGRQPGVSWIILLVGLMLAVLLPLYLLRSSQQSMRLQQAQQEKYALEIQLIKSQKMEAIGQFANGIAHDFNNILGSLMGFSNLVRTRFRNLYADETIDRHMDRIDQNVMRGRDLVQKLQTFSRSVPTEPRAVNLPDVVANTLTLIKPLVPATLSISLHSDSDIPVLTLDPVHIDQLVSNLCINAKDSITDTGRLDISLHNMEINELRCASCRQPVHGSYVVLSVRDSGHGIPPELLESIFDPLFTTKTEDKGTGMGLAIIHNIMHLYDGHILVTSELGRGTTFSLLFPDK